jgi:transposase
MSVAYSMDLRERVVEHVRLHNKKSASEIFKVSRPTINKWLEYERRYKSLSARKPPGRRSAIDAKELSLYIAEHPDHYLREIAACFGVSYVSIYYACKRLGISRKKNDTILRARRAKEISVQRRDKKYPS